MHNFKSDMSHCEPGFYVETRETDCEKGPWSSIFQKFSNSKRGNHHLLTRHEPSISASTTATNLSDYQSNSTLCKNKMDTKLEENSRYWQNETEPLNAKEVDNSTKVYIPKDIFPSWESLTTLQKFSMTTSQLITAVAVSWISFIIGISSAYTSPATSSMERDLNITESESSWVGGLLPFGAIAGGLSGGPMIEYVGRRYTLLSTDVLFLIALAVNYFANHHYYVYASRVFVGLSVGIASLTLPVYLGETIQPEVRGTLGLLPTAFGNIGILVCFSLGMVLEWRELAGFTGLLTIPFLLFFFYIPETPRWYVSKSKPQDALASLQKLRGSKQDVTKELDELTRTQKEAELKTEKISDLFTKNNLKPLLIVLGLMFFQQFSGINAVIFYTVKIFKASGSSLQPYICTIIVGAVNFFSTFLATVLIDKLGRKMLLYISSVSMITSLAALGTYYYLLKIEVPLASYGWAPLVSLVIYVLGFSLGFGPIPWLMMGEILPAKVRGPAASIATAFNWICTFIITKTFLIVINAIGIHTTFWFFSIVVCVALVFTILFVPETRGQSLEDIERSLAGVKVRRMSSAVNLKPFPSTLG